jgi:Flp pilus assembly pilin Flp
VSAALRRLWGQESGDDTVEYALLTAFFVLVLVIALYQMGRATNQAYNSAGSTVAGVSGSGGSGGGSGAANGSAGNGQTGSAGTGGSSGGNSSSGGGSPGGGSSSGGGGSVSNPSNPLPNK